MKTDFDIFLICISFPRFQKGFCHVVVSFASKRVRCTRPVEADKGLFVCFSSESFCLLMLANRIPMPFRLMQRGKTCGEIFLNFFFFFLVSAF
jgi:hypothetical protein